MDKRSIIFVFITFSTAMTAHCALPPGSWRERAREVPKIKGGTGQAILPEPAAHLIQEYLMPRMVSVTITNVDSREIRIIVQEQQTGAKVGEFYLYANPLVSTIMGHADRKPGETHEQAALRRAKEKGQLFEQSAVLPLVPLKIKVEVQSFDIRTGAKISRLTHECMLNASDLEKTKQINVWPAFIDLIR